MPEISRLELWNAYRELKKKPNPLDLLLVFVKDKLKVDSPNEAWEKKVKTILSTFTNYCNKSYKSPQVSYKNEIFMERNKLWLGVDESFPEAPVSPQPGPSTSSGTSSESGSKIRGRSKETDFNKLKPDSKRKRTKEMRDGKVVEEIAFATESKLREVGKGTSAKIIKKVIESSPRTVNMIFLSISNIKRTESGNLDDGSPIPFTLEEAVVHQIECDLTKEKYILNRKRLIEKRCKIFPSYEKIAAYKLQCLPQNIIITETKASVSLQDMLNHTASRLVKVQEEVFSSEKIQGDKLELISKIGFDGSSNHSMYNQMWKDDLGFSDHNMVLTALVPLVLHQKNESAENVNILWMNQKASSTVHCRPLELEFTKETNDYIKQRSKELIDASHSLNDTLVQVGGKEFKVTHRVILTMVDGKVTSAITDTGNATCNVCKTKPSQMNNIDRIVANEDKYDTSALQFGCSVLHLNIRFLEYFMNIAKRRNVAEQCYGKYTAEDNAKIDAQHKRICRRLKTELGLIIDQPSSKGGNTNTGNNARRFFANALKVCEITGLDLDLLQKSQVVMRTLSCGYAIDTEIFKTFCHQLARDFVRIYPWWYMPSAIHLALIHGAAMIEALPVPIGMLSEEPLESSHKVVRYHRLHHTRKLSREATMTDLLKGLLVHTDPLIASLRRPPKPKGSLDNWVMSMLVGSEERETAMPYVMDREESDLDDPDMEI